MTPAQTSPRWSARVDLGFFGGIWVALMVLGRTRMFNDAGTMWHTAAGYRMLGAGRVIRTDPFSFTRGGEPWVPISWLAECGMAAVDAIGGRDGQLLVTATALAALYGWIGRRLLRSGLHPLPTLVLILLVLAASSTHFLVRPLVASLIALGITFALLIDVEAGRSRPSRLAWLVPLFLVWTNVHGAMLGGLVTVGLAAGGWVVASIGRRDRSPGRLGRGGGLALLVLLCGATAFINPYGARLPLTWVDLMRSSVLPRLVMEHRAPGWHDAELWAVLALGAVYAATLIGTLRRRPRVTWLIPLPWLAMALMRVRHGPLFAITAVLAVADILPCSAVGAWLARPGRDLFRPTEPGPTLPPTDRRWWRPAVVPVALVLVLSLHAAGVRAPVVGRGWAQLDPATWPVGLIADLDRISRDRPAGARVFNDYEFGGFLIEHAPNLKVFIDDRWELYGDARLEQFRHAQARDPARIDHWLARDRVDYVFVAVDSGFDRRVASLPGWTLIGRDPVAALYGRTPAVGRGAGSTDAIGPLRSAVGVPYDDPLKSARDAGSRSR